MVDVFVRHEFCLCGICYLPALSSTFATLGDIQL